MSPVKKAKRKSSLTGKKRVTFAVDAEPGSEISVAGTFNEWDPARHPLSCKNGVYQRTMLLPKGRHEYKYVVNGVWCVDPNCAEWAPNELGSLNSVLVLR